MDKTEVLKRKIAHGLYLSLPKDVADDILKKMDEYTQQVNEQYVCNQAMAYEAWLCEIGATKTISSRPDYTDFINHQNQQ